ncbi:MAG: exosome complex protein Rrp42 [Nanoarchaeota archaeon]|nr:exosome complex protein Rrp42 [Nanoarchaeota archaeon]
MYREIRNHIIKNLKAGIRFDGRKALEYRKPITVEYGFTKTAEGSAKVTIGETEVICGIKTEIGKPYPDSPNEGTMMVGAEFLPLSNPEFEAGPPGIDSIELARVVDRGIRESKCIDFKSLCLEPGEKAWTIIIDICPLNDAGNLLDASALAALAALKDFRFPKLDEDGKIVYKEKGTEKIKLLCEPVECTVIKVGEFFIVDPIIDEQKAVDARLTVAVLRTEILLLCRKAEIVL